MHVRTRLIATSLLVAVAACTRAPIPAPSFPDDCVLLPEPSRRADTVSVALFDAVTPEYAPWGHNDGERMVFGHLYETLIAVDCTGDVRPGLAQSWRRFDGGRRWRFQLRPDARFWNGERVTAGDVVAAWQDALTLGVGIDSASAVDASSVDVYLSQPRRDVPLAMASHAFAVARVSADSRWPLGTGAYEVVENHRSGRILLVPARGRRGPALRFVDAGRRDARDVLQDGADVVVTTDPAVVEYASGQPQFTTVALPWTTTHVLVSPTRARALRLGESPSQLPQSLAEALARDAVRSDARAHASSSWWEDADCAPGLPRGAATPLSPLRHIVYPADDNVAREIASRLVALAGSGTTDAAAIAVTLPGLDDDHAPASARGAARGAFSRDLAVGSELAYVVALPTHTPLPCRDRERLLRAAPWLDGVDLSRAVVPLVDTRARAIVTDCGVRLVVDWFGAVTVVDAAALED